MYPNLTLAMRYSIFQRSARNSMLNLIYPTLSDSYLILISPYPVMQL